jgi:hypothetical protein
MITRGTVMIATEGSVVGQVNGLSVLSLGDFAFGQPTRITATARPGSGQVVDIEREARMGGRIHSKAVMILSRYLANRYARYAAVALGEPGLRAVLWRHRGRQRLGGRGVRPGVGHRPGGARPVLRGDRVHQPAR